MSGPLSAQYVYGVYVPSIVVLAGCSVARPDMLPVAIAVVVILAGYQLLNSGSGTAAADAANAAKRKVTTAVANSATGVETKEDGTVLTKTFQNFPLSEKKVISHNTAVYRFKLPSDTSILGLPIGQHISVKAHINGTDVMRSYTPVTSDEDLGHFDLLVKSYPTGNISKLMGEMKIGDKLLFAGPKGAMVYTPNMMRHIGMIAGGTGITPMWQIVTAITKNRPTDKTEVDLIFANVNPEDILMKKELDELAAKDKGFRVHYVLNNPPEGWKGGVGFVTPDIIKASFPPPSSDTKVLICGPPPMVKAMKTATEGLGYEKARPVSKLADQVFCF